MDSMEIHGDGFLLTLHKLDNGTYTAHIQADNMSHILVPAPHEETKYDDQGALYYVVAVVLIYGFSIILMIGSLVRKDDNDKGINNYMKGMDKFRRLQRRQEKFKTRLAMQKKKVHYVLGSDRAIVTEFEEIDPDATPCSARTDSTDVIFPGEEAVDDVCEPQEFGEAPAPRWSLWEEDGDNPPTTCPTSPAYQADRPTNHNLLNYHSLPAAFLPPGADSGGARGSLSLPQSQPVSSTCPVSSEFALWSAPNVNLASANFLETEEREADKTVIWIHPQPSILEQIDEEGTFV